MIFNPDLTIFSGLMVFLTSFYTFGNLLFKA